jgi:hypothetical protein
MREKIFTSMVFATLFATGVAFSGCMSDLNPSQLRCTETEGCPTGYVCRAASLGTASMCCKLNDPKCGVLSDAAIGDSQGPGILGTPDGAGGAADIPLAADVPQGEDALLGEDGGSDLVTTERDGGLGMPEAMPGVGL